MVQELQLDAVNRNEDEVSVQGQVHYVDGLEDRLGLTVDAVSAAAAGG